MTTVKTDVTAEVATLTIGDRRITLSMYRQLDWVSVSEIEPLGRVRDPKEPGALHVIGQHTKTGALVRASLVEPSAEDYRADMSDLVVLPYSAPRKIAIDVDGQPSTLTCDDDPERSRDLKKGEWRWRDEQGEAEATTRVRQAREKWEATQSEYQARRALPLLVL